MTDLLGHLVAHYKMNDNAASIVVVDSKGLSNGTAQRNTSLMHATGKIGGALSFNGTNDYINTNNSFQSVFQNSFTINLECSPNATQNTQFPAIFGQETLSPASAILMFLVTNSKMQVYYNVGVNQISALTPSDIFQTGIWKMITVVFNQLTATTGNIVIYVNGVLNKTGNTADIIFSDYSTTNMPVIGASSVIGEGIFDHFFGSLDNVRIFNKALTAEEITFLYNAGAGVEDIRTVTASATGGGSVSPAGAVEIIDGANQTFTATPATGNYIKYWKLDGTIVQYGGTSYTLQAVTADHTVEVTFGTPRTIKAIIEREQPGALDGVPGITVPQLTISVANDPVAGICTATSIASQNEFDAALIVTAQNFLDTFGETITYEPSGSVLDINLDYVVLPVRIGETAQKRRITGIIEQDAGMLKLAIR